MTACRHESGASALHIMSLNVQRPSPLAWRRDARWNVRRDRLRALLQTEKPALLGAQEVMPEQAVFMQGALGPTYGFVGRGRHAGGTGEGCPVIYDTERLELVDWQQAALSDTPHVAGSRSWGNVFPRITVTADFRDRETAAELRFINTHLDPLCTRSQIRSVDTIRTAVAGSSSPTIVTGDLNAGPSSRTLQALLAGGTLVDAWHAAQERLTPEFATYANYRPPRRGSRIDWIVTTPDISVTQVAVNADPIRGGWVSDHLPVQAEVVIPTPVPLH